MTFLKSHSVATVFAARRQGALADAVREKQERLELMVQALSEGTMEWEIATDRLRFSDRFRELVGLQEEETTVYATFEERLHPDDRAPTFAAMQAHLEQGDPYLVEYRLRSREGGWRWFESRAVTIRDGSGKPLRVIGSVNDIDARKRGEEAEHARTAEVEQARDRGGDAGAGVPGLVADHRRGSQLGEERGRPRHVERAQLRQPHHDHLEPEVQLPVVNRDRRSAGFSLMELMISVALMGVGLAGLAVAGRKRSRA